MWPDKAGEERGREGKQTEQEAGAQCSGIPSHTPTHHPPPTRGLLGKMFMDDSILECSQMRESFNWPEAPAGLVIKRWTQIYGSRTPPPTPCVFYVLGRPCGSWLTNQTKTQAVVERESSETKQSSEFSLWFLFWFFLPFFVHLKKQRMICGLAAADVVSRSRRTRTM